MESRESGDKILDRPDRKVQSGAWLWVGYLSLGLLLTGLILRYMQKDGAMYPIALGFAMMVARYIGLFFRRRRSATAWLYLTGHVALLSCVLIMYTGTLINPAIFMVPACCYLAGLLIPDKANSGNATDIYDSSDSETE
jgi:FtsH-binding integral membrane protein